MNMDFNKIIELSEKCLNLNPKVKFYDYNKQRYFLLSVAGYPICFAKIDGTTEKFFKDFDGLTRTGDIIERYSFDNCLELLYILYKCGILISQENRNKDREPEKIYTLTLYPTSGCNLRCSYCYASAGELPPVNLSLEKSMIWIDYFFNNLSDKAKGVRFGFHGGGEPTYSPSLMKNSWLFAKELALKKNLPIILWTITNGSFNKDTLDWLISEKARVLFSIDGPKEIHDKHRIYPDGKGSFDKVIKNLNALTANNINAGIRCTVTRHNIKHISDLVDIAAECKVKIINFASCHNFGRSKDTEKEAPDYDEFMQYYIQAFRKAINNNITVIGPPLMFLRKGCGFFCNDYDDLSFALTPEGYLSPCPEVSLKSDPASELFFCGKVNDNGSIEFYRDKISNLKSRLHIRNPECVNCFLEYNCSLGCSIINYRKYNNILSIDKGTCLFYRNISSRLIESIISKEINIVDNQSCIDYRNIVAGNGIPFIEFLSFQPLNINK